MVEKFLIVLSEAIPLQQFGTTKNGILLIGAPYVQIHWSKAYAYSTDSEAVVVLAR